MRFTGIAMLATVLVLPFLPAQGAMEPEEIGQLTLDEPQDSWIVIRNDTGPGFIFDAATAEMKGLLSFTPFTPGIEIHRGRSEIYAPESYYSRGYRGERTDVVTIYDIATLSPKAEVRIPNKVAAFAYRDYVGLMDDRYLAVFNMTPAQSVSIVDVRKREFLGEVSTPGCALIMPTGERGFMQLCGDGNLQLIRMDRNGKEQARIRSDKFFDVETDPVFDKPMPTKDGWLLVSNLGQVFDATTDGDDIAVTDPWSMLTDADRAESWRPGGFNPLAHHRELDLTYVLMHQGGEDTHEDPGTEVWVLSRSQQRRIGRIPLAAPGLSLYVTQGEAPLLIVGAVDENAHVFDALKMTPLHTINELGGFPLLMQGM